MTRLVTYAGALREAAEICMTEDPSVFVVGLGVADVSGIFGSTTGLREKFGRDRVREMPVSENAMTGIIIGAALTGMRPILTHQRVDFALLSMEQIVNQAAKWHFMFGGKASVPIVIRMLVGRGWGQGPQHTQSLQSFFAHVPGLKVIMPANAYDAKGMMISAIEDNNPVISIEHRWLYNIEGEVPEGKYTVPIGEARVLREGRDVTIVALSYMALEAVRAADILATQGLDAEVIDMRTVLPVDWDTILNSVRKTGRVVVADTGSRSFGVSAEIVAQCAERAFGDLKAPPARVASPDSPAPTSAPLLIDYYPRDVHIADAALKLTGRELDDAILKAPARAPLDIPDPDFTGPF